MSTLMLAVTFVLVSYIQESESIVLCDSACISASSSLGICNKTRSPGKTTLTIMGFFPCNVGSFRGRALTVAGQMAALAVRSNSSLLQNYSLELAFDNTMCSRTAGIRAFIRQLQDATTGGPLRYMIVGPGCSSSAVLIAETAPFYSLTQISYTATSITLSDKQRFPTFLRTISSDNASIAYIGDLVREYNWKQIAIISLNNANYINLTNAMVDSLSAIGVSVLTERLSIDPASSINLQLVEDIIQQLNHHHALSVQRLSVDGWAATPNTMHFVFTGSLYAYDVSGARVVLLNVFEDLARELFCFVYRKGMVYPEYLYITYYYFSTGWWTEPISSCTVDQLVSAIDFSIAIDYYPEPPPSKWNDPTDVGFTYNEFWEYFRGNISVLGYPSIEALSTAGNAYDAVWAAALALDSVDRQLRGGALPGMTSLLNYNYSNSEINNLIFNAAKDRVFIGVTGKVSINKFGDREPLGRFFQYAFGNRSNIIPTFVPFLRQENGTLIYTEGFTLESVFPAGLPATALLLNVHVSLLSLGVIFSIAGIIFSIVCIVFNLVFRKKRCVKLTSPYLNVVIFIGAIFFYVDVILFGIDINVAPSSVVDGLCQARIWISSIGFSLLFGPILVKAFRVYYIFRNVEKKKKTVITQDYVLLLMVAVMVVIDVHFLVVVSVDMWRLRLSSTLLQRENGQIPLIVNICQSPSDEIWLNNLLAYKSIYLLIGLLLASQTYNVKIKRLRDSRLIVVSVFAIFIISVVLTIVGIFVTVNPDALYALLALFILSLVTGVQVLLFLPRAIELIRDPSGEIDITGSTTVTNANIGGGDTISPADNAKIVELRNTVDTLRKELDKNSPSARRRVNLSPNNGHTETESFEMGSKDSFNFDLTDDHGKTQEK